MRIKEGDEWKAVFMMPEGSFKPTVMFFGLTNSPATFQAMMNELLRDLINTGKVAAFIDDVIIRTETEEGYNKIVAEVIRRLEENDLYVKLEKYRCVTNFIQLVSPQPVDRFSQTKLRWKAQNEGYPHMCGMHKSDNKQLRYQDISSCKSFVC